MHFLSVSFATANNGFLHGDRYKGRHVAPPTEINEAQLSAMITGRARGLDGEKNEDFGRHQHPANRNM